MQLNLSSPIAENWFKYPNIPSSIQVWVARMVRRWDTNVPSLNASGDILFWKMLLRHELEFKCGASLKFHDIHITARALRSIELCIFGISSMDRKRKASLFTVWGPAEMVSPGQMFKIDPVSAKSEKIAALTTCMSYLLLGQVITMIPTSPPLYGNN